MSASRTPRKVSSIRKKACVACSDAKVRCDRSQSTCFRCRTRGVTCVYPGTTSCTEPQVCTGIGSRDSILSPFQDGYVAVDAYQPVTPSSHSAAGGFAPAQQIEVTNQHFVSDSMVCNINAAAIEARWLKPLVSDSEDRPKVIPPGTIVYIRETLRSYVGMVIRSLRLPPFIHQTKGHHDNMSPILAQCCSLLRILSVRTTRSDTLSSELLEREMASILARYISYDNDTCLAAFQAYLIYTMTLYFTCERRDSQVFRQHMMDLQQLASASVSQGLTTVAEMARNRPEWSSWAQAESKRRTLYTMYLFDNLLCATDNLPMFVAVELIGLLAPASRSLWEAESVDSWTKAYNRHMGTFDGGGLRIEELWSPPPGWNQDQILDRRHRVETWLQDTDIFGTALFAVTTATHGV